MDFKSAYISCIICPGGLRCEANLSEIMYWEPFDVLRFDIGHLLQAQMRVAKLKSAKTLFLLLEVLYVKPTCRKPWTMNLQMWSDLARGSSSFKLVSMGCLSSGYNLHWFSVVLDLIIGVFLFWNTFQMTQISGLMS